MLTMEHVITPLQLAEEMSIEDLDVVYGGRRKTSSMKKSAREAYHSLEASLRLGIDNDETSDDHFSEACKLLNYVTGEGLSYNEKSLNALYPEAIIFNAQLPAFDGRRSAFPSLSVDSIGEAHEGLVQILSDRVDRLRRGYLKLPIPEGRRTEIELAGLLSRMGEAALFPYFAVGREERDHRQSQYNHDLYLITENYKKVPIQIKTTILGKNKREYSREVLVIGRNEIEEKYPYLNAEYRNGISTLLTQESRGKLNDRDCLRLNSISRYVIDRVQEHVETNLQ